MSTKKQKTKNTVLLAGLFIFAALFVFSIVAFRMISQQSLDTRSDAAGFGMASENAPLLSCGTMTGDAQRTCERNVLIAFYKNTDGPNWTNHQGWNTSADYCTWYGIGCDSNSLVRSLVLTSNNVVGRLIPEIGNLSQLTAFQIEYNSLSGPIPSQLGNLSHLELLLLSNNSFSGMIPASIGQLASLRALKLNTNKLSGALPSSIASLSSLQSFIFNQQQSGPNAICVSLPAVRNFLTEVENINPEGDDVQPGPSVQEGLPECPNSFTTRNR